MPSMSQATLPVINQLLGALDRIFDKAAAHCEARKIDPSVLLGSRLFPDMFPLTRQVQIACDFAKGAAARLAGREVPSWPDNEASIADVKARIKKTLDFVNGIPASEIDGSEEKVLKIKLGRNAPETDMSGQVYLSSVVMPNFHFHCATAYAILRHNGIEVGKGDYLGRV